MMIPINIEESKMSILANTLGCSIGAMPFTYLGLPLGTTKPQVSDFLPLISKCERRLISTSRFLSQAGRLQMTNAVLSALPTFHLCTFKMHKTVLHQIDKYRKHCLWRGADINAKTPPKVAWDSVCLPKSEGGLGVLQLEIHNEALLLKNLHKFFNKDDIPWVHLIWEKHYRSGRLPNHTLKGSFWWRDVLKLLGKFKTCASVLVQSGSSCSLWHDPWCDPVPSQAYPHLFSFSRFEFISIAKARTLDISNLLQWPLSEEAFDQALIFAQSLADLDISDSDDIWFYRWGPSFSPRRAYLHLLGPRQVPQAFKWLWKSSVQKNTKFFSGCCLRIG
jgi:hypothetical protein